MARRIQVCLTAIAVDDRLTVTLFYDLPTVTRLPEGYANLKCWRVEFSGFFSEKPTLPATVADAVKW